MTKDKIARISITIPEITLQAFDEHIAQQQYDSRSQAIVDMMNRELISQHVVNNAVMVGTLTLLYDRRNPNFLIQLQELQHQYLEQVISSLHIQLDDQKILEVMLMQGKSEDLRDISRCFIALKGVIKGHLELMDAVMPPLQQNEH